MTGVQTCALPISPETASFWRDLCGDESVIEINSTKQLPEVISGIIGLTEGTVDVTGIEQHVGRSNSHLISQLSNIDIGAQARLRHAMEHPVPKAGDIFMEKGEIWPIQDGESSESETPVTAPSEIDYL